MNRSFINMKDSLCSRALKNKCPICDKKVEEDSIVINYNDAKLEVCKKHIKYKDKK